MIIIKTKLLIIILLIVGLSKAQNDRRIYDIIIIGAGISGLAAADNLIDTGKNVLISTPFSDKKGFMRSLSSLVMLIAKLFGESSGIEFCQLPNKFLLAENVIKLNPIATVNAKI